MLHKLKEKKGFTLLEVIISVAIFSIITIALMTAFVNINKVYNKAIQVNYAQDLSANLIAKASDELIFTMKAELSNDPSAAPAAGERMIFNDTSTDRVKVQEGSEITDLLQDTMYNKLRAEMEFTKVSDTVMKLDVRVYNPPRTTVLYSTSKSINMFSMEMTDGAGIAGPVSETCDRVVYEHAASE